MENKQEQQKYEKGMATSRWSYSRHTAMSSKRVFFQRYFQLQPFFSTRALDLGQYVDSLFYNDVASNEKEEAILADFKAFKKQHGFEEVGGKVKVEVPVEMNEMTVVLNGEIDRVFQKEGKWVILDIKSGITETPKKSLKEQLTFYLLILQKLGKPLLKGENGHFPVFGFYVVTFGGAYAEDCVLGKTDVIPLTITQKDIDNLLAEIESRHKEACAFEKEFLKNGCRSNDPVLAEYAWLDYQIRFLKEELDFMQPEVLKKIKEKVYFDEVFGTFSVRKGKKTVWTDEAKKREYLAEGRKHKEAMLERFGQYMQEEKTESVNYRIKEEDEYTERKPLERPEEPVDLDAIPF